MNAAMTALTRDELLALSIATDNALAWAETVNRETEARQLRESRRIISAEWTRRETINRRYRDAY
jgi:hypothetical protein